MSRHSRVMPGLNGLTHLTKQFRFELAINRFAGQVVWPEPDPQPELLALIVFNGLDLILSLYYKIFGVNYKKKKKKLKKSPQITTCF
jgi:hypothetical protein